jgi:hypothetical protein
MISTWMAWTEKCLKADIWIAFWKCASIWNHRTFRNFSRSTEQKPFEWVKCGRGPECWETSRGDFSGRIINEVHSICGSFASFQRRQFSTLWLGSCEDFNISEIPCRCSGAQALCRQLHSGGVNRAEQWHPEGFSVHPEEAPQPLSEEDLPQSAHKWRGESELRQRECQRTRTSWRQFCMGSRHFQVKEIEVSMITNETGSPKLRESQIRIRESTFLIPLP